MTFWLVAVVGAFLSLVGGVSAGTYFKTGVDSFERPMTGSGGLIFGEADVAPVAYMTDASGKIPDYVLGTDFTHPRLPEPLVQVAYEPEPLPAWDIPTPSSEPGLKAVDRAPAPPPSIHGDILAGVDLPAQTQTPAEPEAQPASVIVADEGAPRVIAAAY